MPLGAIAHAELQAEIDAQADEQNREIDRDQIERADHHHADRGRHGEPDNKRDKDREDDAEPAQRKPQDHEHDCDRHRGVERGILLDGGEFFVGHRHRTGQPQARLIFAGDIEVGGGLANGFRGALAWLELGVIQRGLDFEEAQLLARRRRPSLHHFVPGKACRLAGIDVLDRVRGEIHRPLHIVERELTALHAEQAELEGLDDAAERRVAGEHLNQTLRLPENLHLRLEIFHRLEQQAVLREERPAFRLFDGVEQILLRRELRHQRVGRFIDQFRGGRIDHRDDQFELRERLFESRFALPPIDIRRNELVDVRRHGEMRGRIPGRQHGKQNGQSDHRPGIFRGNADGADDKGGNRFHERVGQGNTIVSDWGINKPAFEASRQRRKGGGHGCGMGYGLDLGRVGALRCPDLAQK